MSAGIVAFGAVSAMGEGALAASAGTVGERARTCITKDAQLESAGLARPHAARAVGQACGSSDPATALLVRALTACLRELDVALPGWRARRVGLALGTSSGGMHAAEQLFAAYLRGPQVVATRADVAGALYFAPMRDAVGTTGLTFEPATMVMGACAASTLAIGVGMRWLDADECDVALVGGFDAVTTFVAAGFEVLRATTAELPPRPFRLGRDGMALGEGAAVVALVPSRLATGARVHVTGFAASSDAVHLTAPDRAGRGLTAAARAALAEAGLSRVDLVSPHGSATPYSDAAEARALAETLGDAARSVALHPFKAQIGHTLGASGVLEALACVDALCRGVLPASAGSGPLDPDAPAHLLETAREATPRTALKLSAAFGGANGALVVSRDAPAPSPPKPARSVFLGAAVRLSRLPTTPELAATLGWPVDRVARADALARWVMAAVAALVAEGGSLAGAGIVVAQSFATTETNAAFFAKIHEKGPRAAEPRKFPYTSPNAAGGDAGVAFGLTGPSFAVGAGLHAALEAIAVAVTLVRAGDAERMVVVAVDDVGPTVARMAETLGVVAEPGAIAVVVSADPRLAVARVDRALSGVGPRPSSAPVACGHRALLPLLESPLPAFLEASSPDLRAAGGPPVPGGSVAWGRVDLTAWPPRG